MRCFLIDYTNDGIVYIGKRLAVANKIKEGLLDTEITFLTEAHRNYNTIKDVDLNRGHYTWQTKSTTLVEMAPSSINPLYLEKRRLAQLRAGIFNSLFLIAFWASRKTHVSPIPGIEYDLQTSLEKSDVTSNIFDFNIEEYALTNNMTNLEAYKEINLRVENYRTQKIRIHSQFEYFAKKINRATKQEEIVEINDEIIKKFIKDTLM